MDTACESIHDSQLVTLSQAFHLVSGPYYYRHALVTRLSAGLSWVGRKGVCALEYVLWLGICLEVKGEARSFGAGAQGSKEMCRTSLFWDRGIDP